MSELEPNWWVDSGHDPKTCPCCSGIINFSPVPAIQYLPDLIKFAKEEAELAQQRVELAQQKVEMTRRSLLFLQEEANRATAFAAWTVTNIDKLEMELQDAITTASMTVSNTNPVVN